MPTAVSTKKFFGVSEKKIEEIINNKNNYYITFPIKKSSGKLRWIDAPQEDLKNIQKRLVKVLEKIPIHKAAVGFRKEYSVKTGAERHFGNKVVLTMDINNFFPSIKSYSVLANIARFFSYLTLKQQTYFMELVTFRGSLPQGCPTSPALANLHCIPLDGLITNFLKKDMVYTRYADDITLSHKNKNYPIGQHIPDIIRVVRSAGFEVNFRKTRVLRPNRRILVTGVVINDKISVKKYYWRNLRAEIHNLKKNPQTQSPGQLRILRGKIEWVKSLNPERGMQLLKQFSKLNIKQP